MAMVIIHGTLHIIAAIGDIIIGDIMGLFGAHLIMATTIAGHITTLTDMVMVTTDIMATLIETMDTTALIMDIMEIEVIIITEVLPIAQAEEEIAIQEEI